VPYSIVEIDGIQINPISKRFPVEIVADPHMINDPTIHMGVLDDNQIPISIMRSTAHHNDPHTMLVDGRDVSEDGLKLDTIEPGAQVNNLTNQQANSLISGSHSAWHNHDDWYYRKSQLQISGQSQVNWNNLTSVPSTFTPSVHNHDDRYFTKSEITTSLNLKSDTNHIHDDRYYTEIEVDQLISAASFGISGSVNTYEDLPITNDVGMIYIVKQTTGLHEEGFYRWDNEWVFLANNTGSSVHNETIGLNDGDYKHLTQIQFSMLTEGNDTTLHSHNSLYNTKSEITDFLATKSDINHLHDTRYYIKNELYNKTEIDILVSAYYTKSQLDNGQLNSLYYTEIELNNGQLDTRYYTKNIIDNNIYTKYQLDNGQLDTRYYTETELNDSGAQYIGIIQVSGMNATNVQLAIEELNTKISSTEITLQEGYNSGNEIIISSLPVKIESTNTNSPLEITNRSTAPSTNLSAGQIAIIDNDLYIYDGNRSKWITPTKTLLFGKSGGSDGTNLRPVGDSANQGAGYKMSKNGTITSITIQSIAAVNKIAYLRINNSNEYTINIVSGVFNSSTDINFNLNDVISVYIDPAGSAINEATCVIEFGWRK